jgi:hypothetical protein
MNKLYIAGIVLLILTVTYIIYRTQEKKTPILDASVAEVIGNSTLFQHSSSNMLSVHYSYGVWLYVNDYNYKYGVNKNIFRVNDDSSTLIEANLGSIQNNLTVTVNTGFNGNSSMYNCSVKNFPLQKWMYLFVSVSNKVLDVYIDGKMVKTCIMPDSSLISSHKEQITAQLHSPEILEGGNSQPGFSGRTSSFMYWPRESNPKFVWDQYVKGWGKSKSLTKYSVQLQLSEAGEVKKRITF